MCIMLNFLHYHCITYALHAFCITSVLAFPLHCRMQYLCIRFNATSFNAISLHYSALLCIITALFALLCIFWLRYLIFLGVSYPLLVYSLFLIPYTFFIASLFIFQHFCFSGLFFPGQILIGRINKKIKYVYSVSLFKCSVFTMHLLGWITSQYGCTRGGMVCGVSTR